jgi:hypothetical protein
MDRTTSDRRFTAADARRLRAWQTGADTPPPPPPLPTFIFHSYCLPTIIIRQFGYMSYITILQNLFQPPQPIHVT